MNSLSSAQVSNYPASLPPALDNPSLAFERNMRQVWSVSWLSEDAPRNLLDIKVRFSKEDLGQINLVFQNIVENIDTKVIPVPFKDGVPSYEEAWRVIRARQCAILSESSIDCSTFYRHFANQLKGPGPLILAPEVLFPKLPALSGLTDDDLYIRYASLDENGLTFCSKQISYRKYRAEELKNIFKDIFIRDMVYRPEICDNWNQQVGKISSYFSDKGRLTKDLKIKYGDVKLYFHQFKGFPISCALLVSNSGSLSCDDGKEAGDQRIRKWKWDTSQPCSIQRKFVDELDCAFIEKLSRITSFSQVMHHVIARYEKRGFREWNGSEAPDYSLFTEKFCFLSSRYDEQTAWNYFDIYYPNLQSSRVDKSSILCNPEMPFTRLCTVLADKCIKIDKWLQSSKARIDEYVRKEYADEFDSYLLRPVEGSDWLYDVSFNDPLTSSIVHWHVWGQEQIDRAIDRMSHRTEHFLTCHALRNEAERRGRFLSVVPQGFQFQNISSVGDTDYIEYNLTDERCILHMYSPISPHVVVTMIVDTLSSLEEQLIDWWDRCDCLRDCTVSSQYFLCGQVVSGGEEEKPYIDFLLAVGDQVKQRAIETMASEVPLWQDSGSELLTKEELIRRYTAVLSQQGYTVGKVQMEEEIRELGGNYRTVEILLEGYRAYCNIFALPYYRDQCNRHLREKMDEVWDFIKGELHTFITQDLLPIREMELSPVEDLAEDLVEDLEEEQMDQSPVEDDLGEEQADSPEERIQRLDEWLVLEGLGNIDPLDRDVMCLTYAGVSVLLLQAGIFQTRQKQLSN